MNTARLHVDENVWDEEGRNDHRKGGDSVRRKQIVPAVAGLCLIAADVALVSAAFMLAYAARFSIDENLPSLGLDRYLRLAVLVGLFSSVLLVTHGLYDADTDP